MSFMIQIAGATLLLFGSFIVLQAVWEADQQPEGPRQRPAARPRPIIEPEYRRAA